jgi:two-component system sensor histidine kinase KdpD
MSQFEHLPSLKAREEPRWRHTVIDGLLAIVSVALVTGVISVFHLYPRIPTIAFAYLLVVLALASLRGRFVAILASLVAFFSYDFFLVSPLYTFVVAKFEDLLALFVFLATAIITSQFASALRRHAEEATRRERETCVLYQLMRTVNGEEELEAQLSTIARAVVDVFSPWGVGDCSLLLPDGAGTLTLQASTAAADQVQLSPDEEATAGWVMKQGQTVELYEVTRAPHVSVAYAPHVGVRSAVGGQRMRRHVRMIPLKVGKDVVGVMRLLMEDHPRLLVTENSLGVERERPDPQTAFFWTFLDQASSVIERVRLRQEHVQMQVLQQTDALRAALLSSVSHDLRAPLSSIKATTSSLLQEDVRWDENTQRSSLQAIEREVDRLNRLVGNLLDLSRIEGNALKPEKEWYPLDELIYDVLGRMQPLLHDRLVQTSLPQDLPPIEVDYLQIDQVLTNLIENAVRYTPAESPIEISARVEGELVSVSVADRGPGIPPAKSERIFDKFYRVLDMQRNGTHPRGSGLGLAVCRGLIEAHGGRIWVKNRASGGAVFSFTLPMGKSERIMYE